MKDAPLRPLDALRLLRDPRCTCNPIERWGQGVLVLRADNMTWEAKLGMSLMASDLGCDRATVVRLIPKLVTGGDGFPITVVRLTGEKVDGHRRDANTYTVGIRPGWAWETYEGFEARRRERAADRGTAPLGAECTYGDGCTVHLGIGAGCTGDRCTMRQDLPSSLPSSLPKDIPAPNGAVTSKVPVQGKRSKGKPAPEGYQDVVDAYFRLFETARGEKPYFEGPSVAAMLRFVRGFGRDRAIAILERVYATGNWWRAKATIIGIARDPDNYTSASGGKGSALKQSANGPRAWRVPEGTS